MEPRNCFLSHPTHCKIMYWADYLYTIYVRITFWSDSVSKKFNPPPCNFFQNSYTELSTLDSQNHFPNMDIISVYTYF